VPNDNSMLLTGSTGVMAARATQALLALGANVPGAWGSPHEAIRRAVHELACATRGKMMCSHIYSTPPLGSGRQPNYLNAVIRFEPSLSPAALLRLAKRLERHAGRRLGRHWGPRPLDIDILDYGGRRVGRAARKRRSGHLILPHPELHKRAFVLVPLLEIAPRWHYPALGLSARAFLQRLPASARAGIRQCQTLDLAPSTCEKQEK
jgi:2-amino-4-hydroxy-6-hydroxymethyldihydropteridine diphosphokinase